MDKKDKTHEKASDEQLEQIKELGSSELLVGKHKIYCLTVIGEIEGHMVLPEQSKTTKYEHVIPQLVAIEESRDIEGLVQTSLNLGILKTTNEEVTATFCVRSSVASQREMLEDRICCLTKQLGGSVEITGEYPAWEYKQESVLREKMIHVFRKQYQREPRIEAIHAGLECGLLCGKIPGLDCVSIGPDIKDIHTPRECLSIASVQRVWDFLLEVLKELK